MEYFEMQLDGGESSPEATLWANVLRTFVEDCVLINQQLANDDPAFYSYDEKTHDCHTYPGCVPKQRIGRSFCKPKKRAQEAKRRYKNAKRLEKTFWILISDPSIEELCHYVSVDYDYFVTLIRSRWDSEQKIREEKLWMKQQKLQGLKKKSIKNTEIVLQISV